MKNSFKFTYENLENFLTHMISVAPVIPLRQAPLTKGGFIILRHDVDLDVYPAYTMAKLEKKLGIKSSFFIMTTCPFYNPSSMENRKLLQLIIDNGHEIGLHFDPTVYPSLTDQELGEKANYESKFLESITGEKVKSISLHNPAAHGNYVEFKNFINAYHEDYFSKEKYISDSYMEKSFLDKDPYQFVSRAKNNTCQVLLHPCQFTESGKSFKELREDYITRRKIIFNKSFQTLIREET